MASRELPAFGEDIPAEIRQSQLFHDYLDRLREGRDLRIIISASDAATGVGKTTLAVALAYAFDIHGWTAERSTLNPREFVDIYGEAPPGSAIILDEAEQAVDKRRSVSNDVMAVGHAFATLRYKQVFGILTLPDKNTIDDRIVTLCDYWILCQGRGSADVYRLKTNDFTGEDWNEPTESLEWPNLDDDPEYQKLTRKKTERMEGEIKQQYIHVDEFEEAKQNFYNKFRKQTRYLCVKGIYDYCQDNDIPLSQAAIGEAIGRYDEDLRLEQSMVSKIVNSDSFEEIYES